MKLILLSVLAALALALPASAFDIDAMTAEERQAFRAEVRAYLLDNPDVLMEAMSVLEQRQQQQQAARDAGLIAANSEALFDSDSYVGGDADGDVTLVEFIDYRCSYCRRAFPEVQELVASDGDIRLIVKEFPILGEQSVLASRFAIATRMVEGDAAYKEMHDALITMRGDMNELSLELLAEEMGYDAEAISARMNDDAVTETIRESHRLAERLQITGTPTYVLGDQMVRGYVPLEQMRALVAEAREEG